MATMKSYAKRLVSLRKSISGTNALIQEHQAEIDRLMTEWATFTTDVSELQAKAADDGHSTADLNAAVEAMD